jgi:hypothetical protein
VDRLHAEWLFKRGARIMLRWVQAMACVLGIIAFISPAFALTTDELVARLKAAGYTQIREVRSGKITTYRAVISGKEVSLLVDSFGKFMELP